MTTRLPRYAFQRISAHRPACAQINTPSIIQQLPRRCLHLRTAPPSLLRTATTIRQPHHFTIQQQRHESSARPLTDRGDQVPEAEAKEEQPSYEMTFTCRKCLERSSHKISKQGYHHGTILITCPGCKNRHLISDHLKIFSDKSITVEDILKEKGQLLKKGELGSEGDVEFWDDGTQTERQDSKK